MSFVFVSHASEDKQPYIKPLVEALLRENVKVWLDRPGHGESHFGFDDDFIRANDIRSLKTGLDWDQQISSALSSSGAVLVCLSRALCANRDVWADEIAIGRNLNKLVACIVDDVPFEQLPKTLGLGGDIGKIQAERLKPENLNDALKFLEENIELTASDLPEELKREWEIVRKIVNDIEFAFKRSGFFLFKSEDFEKQKEKLSRFPIGPAVRVVDIPERIFEIFSSFFEDPLSAKNFLQYAMRMVKETNLENYTDDQILIKPGEVVAPQLVPMYEYWFDVLSLSGQKSRRSLASFFLTPGSPALNSQVLEDRKILEDFTNWLARSNDAGINSSMYGES